MCLCIELLVGYLLNYKNKCYWQCECDPVKAGINSYFVLFHFTDLEVEMRRSTRAVFAVLFSLMLLSVLFSSSLNYYLQQPALLANKPDKIFWLSQFISKDVAKDLELQQKDLNNITKDISVELSNYGGRQEFPAMDIPIGGTTQRYYRYAIGSSYWEQQTNAVLNMFCMQRWANSIGLTVVEPFVCQSELKFPIEILHNNTMAPNTLRLRDYIDLDYWNAQASESGVPPLETWENFVLRSTKNIIVVIMSHFGAGGTYVNDKINDHPNCHKVMSGFFQKHTRLFRSLQFQAVRNVCFSFFEHVVSVKTFNAGIQIENEKDATIWITEWRGVENGRISFTGLGDNEFGRTQGGEQKLLSMIHSSVRLLNDSKKYIRQIIGVDFYQYDAVVVRVKPISGYTVKMNVKYYNNCASQLENYQSHQKQMISLKNHVVFLAIDMGRFGDMVRADSFDYDTQGKYTGHGTYLFRRFLDKVYGGKSVSSYDEDFMQVTKGITDSGYIGALQKTIAVHAEHVLIVGGHSTFQKVIMQHFARRNASNAVLTLCYNMR